MAHGSPAQRAGREWKRPGGECTAHGGPAFAHWPARVMVSSEPGRCRTGGTPLWHQRNCTRADRGCGVTRDTASARWQREDLAFCADWKVVPLSEVADPERGITYGIVQPGPMTPGGVPIVRVNNVKGGRIDAGDVHYVSRDIAAKYERTRLRGGEVLLTLVGTVGETAIVPPEMAGWNTARAVAVIPVKPEIGPEWIDLCLRSAPLQHLIDVWCTTTVQKTFNLKEVWELPIPLPPLPEQRAIARVLGGLDDKIELNRRMNRTLEDLARGVFREWLDKTSDDAQSAVTQSLIDAGVLVIGDGYRAKRVELRPTGLPFARAGNIDGGFQFNDCEYMGAEGVAAAGEKVSQPLDSVFTSKGTVGRLALVSEATPKFVYAPQLCFWRVKDPARLNPYVLHQWMHDEEFGEQVDMTKGQTDMADYVSLTDQRRMRITLPPAVRQAEIGRHLQRMYRMMAKNTSEGSRLAATRDALLPVLLSGEVRLRSAGTSTPPDRVARPGAGTVHAGAKGRA